MRNALPPLSKQENQELLQKAKAGDDQAKELFFAHNYRLMVYTAQRFRHTNLSLDDRIGLCQLGFLKAFNTVDFDRGVRFSTYAMKCMRNEIGQMLRKSEKWQAETSLDAPRHIDHDGHGLTWNDVLCSPTDADAERRRADREMLADVLGEFSRTASAREREIFRMYYGEEASQYDIARKLGLGQSYVSRLHKAIRAKLQKTAVKKRYIQTINVTTARLKQAKQIKKGAAATMMRKVEIGHLKYLFENTALSNQQIKQITGCGPTTISRYRDRYDNGKMLGVKMDDSVLPALKTFMNQLASEARHKLEQKQQRKASPITTYSLSQEDPAALSPSPTETALLQVAATTELRLDAAAPQPSPTETALQQVVATAEENLGEVPQQVKRISILLDEADVAAIDVFFATVRAQLLEGKTYRFHVQVEAL